MSRRYGIAVAALLLLAACTGLGARLETPRLSFVGLKVVEASLFEQRLEVRLRVQNPNHVDLPVHGLSVDVDLAGEHFARGVSAREFTVPAYGEAEFDMIVISTAAGAVAGILGSGRKGREPVEYRLKGKLSTRLGLLRSIPFEESGTLPLGGERRP